MSDQEILQKAIRKATDNGWPGELLGIVVRQQENGILRLENPHTEEEWAVEEIIFNHKFAKALWGDGHHGDVELYYYKLNDPKKTKRKLWEHMLQEMVIAEDPIKYLGANI